MGELLDAVRERFGDAIHDASDRRGETTIRIAPDDVPGVFHVLKNDPAFDFDFMIDLTAVDYPGRDPRFDVVVHLFSLPRLQRLRVKVGVPEAEPRVPTLSGIWKNANWLERECWDMYGIRFEGHPDLRRILMYPEFEGHPLRKDYPVMKRQPIIPERDPVENPWPERKLRGAS